jgi:hypothetical protein
MSFLKEQINHENKSVVNKRFQLQIDAIRSADIEKVESIILKKKVLSKNMSNISSNIFLSDLQRAFLKGFQSSLLGQVDF